GPVPWRSSASARRGQRRPRGRGDRLGQLAGRSAGQVDGPAHLVQVVDGAAHALGQAGHLGLRRLDLLARGVGHLDRRIGQLPYLGDDLVDRLGGRAGVLGELAYLAGHDREAAPGVAGAGRLDGGVERQQVRLRCDLADRADHGGDPVGDVAQLGDLAEDLEDHRAEHVEPGLRVGDGTGEAGQPTDSRAEPVHALGAVPVRTGLGGPAAGATAAGAPAGATIGEAAGGTGGCSSGRGRTSARAVSAASASAATTQAAVGWPSRPASAASAAVPRPSAAGQRLSGTRRLSTGPTIECRRGVVEQIPLVNVAAFTTACRPSGQPVACGHEWTRPSVAGRLHRHPASLKRSSSPRPRSIRRVPRTGEERMRARIFALGLIGTVAALSAPLLTAVPAQAATPSVSRSCNAPASPGQMSCFALRRTGTVTSGSMGALTTPSGYGPTDLRSAYNLNAAGGTGATVAIVDAYDDPNAEADLAAYRTQFGLTACTTANGCFRKVNQNGAAS